MTAGSNAVDGGKDDQFDLDFTRVFRPVAPLAAAPVPSPVPPVAPLQPKPPGNLVGLARARAERTAAEPGAGAIVVEDHEATRKLLERILMTQGFAVRAAGDSREMVRELRKPPLPRLILLDVGLPRIDGFQILSRLRAMPQTAAIPVVMVTARSDYGDVMRGMTLGADGFLSKPVSVRALREVIETVLWKQ
jgi:CheY-like chemotaxis protein